MNPSYYFLILVFTTTLFLSWKTLDDVYPYNVSTCKVILFHWQGTASEATLVALLGAKAKMIRHVKEEHPDWTDYDIVSKLVGYCSGI